MITSFLSFEFNKLVWICWYTHSIFGIKRVRPIVFCSPDPGAFPANASKGVSYIKGAHFSIVCTEPKAVCDNLSMGKNPSYLWYKNKPSRWVDRIKIHQNYWRTQGYFTTAEIHAFHVMVIIVSTSSTSSLWPTGCTLRLFGHC